MSWPALARLEYLVLWRSRGIALYAAVMAGIVLVIQVLGLGQRLPTYSR